MSQAPGWRGGPWALVVELSVVCPWVCFGKCSQIYIINCSFQNGELTCSKLTNKQDILPLLLRRLM